MSPEKQKQIDEYSAARKRIIQRLENWAAWDSKISDGRPAGLGGSVLGKLISEKAESLRRGIKDRDQGISGKRVYACMIPDTAAHQSHTEEIATERAIEMLPPEIQIVIMRNYRHAGAQNEKAELINISRAQYLILLNRGIDFLIGYFYGQQLQQAESGARHAGNEV